MIFLSNVVKLRFYTVLLEMFVTKLGSSPYVRKRLVFFRGGFTKRGRGKGVRPPYFFFFVSITLINCVI